MKKQTTALAATALLIALAACSPDGVDEAEQGAHIPENQRGAGAGAIAPDIRDAEALSPPQVSETASRGVSTVNENAASASAEPNRNLEERIRAELESSENLEKNGEDLAGVKIEVENAKVQLSGSVSSEEASQEIEDLVREMPGVEEVENRLAVTR